MKDVVDIFPFENRFYKKMNIFWNNNTINTKFQSEIKKIKPISFQLNSFVISF